MPQLDKLIEIIQDNRELILEQDKMPVMKSETGISTVLNQQFTASQILTLLLEIAPAAAGKELSNGKSQQFNYKSGVKSVNVACTFDKNNFVAKFSLNGVRPEPVMETAVQSACSVCAEPGINILLRKMCALKASDLHLTSANRPQVRISGDMKELSDEHPFSRENLRALLTEIMPAHNAAQFEEICDTDFAYEISGLARFRVNVFMDRFGIGAVLRQIPIDIVTAETLGLSKEILNLCFLTKGLVLVTGPTGSGKSTTLCALVDYINRHRKDHIITIEDPIEFVHQRKKCLINQREVHVHTKSFAQALRAALREDPDIVLVGEIRDLETMSIAIETAETGHLVFGTLHTTTAASTVDRIIDQFPAERQSQIRAMLANSLKAVISQTLCKTIGGGRTAIMEILFVNSAISNLIREGKIYQIPSVMQTSKNLGMVTLNDALLRNVVDKVISPDDAYMKAVDKAGLVALLKAKGILVKVCPTDD